MIFFHNDYDRMCHSAVMDKLLCVQQQSYPGYGEDTHCRNAAELIRKACEREDLSVHFLSGGTQTNLTVIAAALRPHQAVIAAGSAHVAVHETGAIEATGHKVVTLPSLDGKLTAQQICDVAYTHRTDPNHEHIAQPKMVYISNPTELGTIYTLSELEAIRQACDQYQLYLYVDGARLGYALTAPGNDLMLPDLARLCDAFYIGGTKVGAMLGEAVVIANPRLGEDFRYIIKQRGGMLAKGWLLGLQFEALLEDGLYFRMTQSANRFAQQLRDTLKALGYAIPVDSPTNQVFVVMPNRILEQLQKEFTYTHWETVDSEQTLVRFCTSWGTTQQDTDALCDALKSLSK